MKHFPVITLAGCAVLVSIYLSSDVCALNDSKDLVLTLSEKNALEEVCHHEF